MPKRKIIKLTLKSLKQSKEPCDIFELHGVAAPALGLLAFEKVLEEMVQQKLVLENRVSTGFVDIPTDWDSIWTGQPKWRRSATYKVTYLITAEGLDYLRFANFRFIQKIWSAFKRYMKVSISISVSTIILVLFFSYKQCNYGKVPAAFKSIQNVADSVKASQ